MSGQSCQTPRACQACAPAGDAKPGKVTAVLDFSHLKTTAGFDPLYLENAPDGRPFVSHFLERALQVDYIEEFIALMHPKTQAIIAPHLRSFPIIKQLVVPEDAARFYNRHEWIEKGRKWSYESIKGGAADVSWYDEVMPLHIIKLMASQVPMRCMLHLHPEAPLFMPSYATQLLDLELKDDANGTGNFPLLIRHAPLGFSPALVTRQGLNLMRRGVSWSPTQVFRYFADLDGLVRMGIHVKNNMGSDLYRLNFTLRSRRDLGRVRGFISALRENGQEPTPDSLKALRERRPELFDEELPREVDLELTSEGYPEACRLPLPGPRGEMSPGLFGKICDELCSWEDGLLSIGDIGDVLRYSKWKDILPIIKSRKPFGLHMVLNAQTLLEKGDEAVAMLKEVEMDMLTVRLTPLSYSPNYKLADFGPMAEKLSKWMHGDQKAPMIHLEMHKHEENWQDFRQVYDWQRDYTLSSNWAPYNDYSGQMPSLRNLPAYMPRERYACRRLACQMYVLPDGTVPLCKQDFSGRFPAGDANLEPLARIWKRKEFSARRSAQAGGGWDCAPLCPACTRWFHT